MTTFHRIIIKCPHCLTLMQDYELMSYTVHGAVTYYSDGYSDDMPSLIDDKGISICDDCKRPFWKEDSKIPEEKLDREKTENLPDAHDTYDLHWGLEDDGVEQKIKFYSNLLEMEFIISG